MTKGFKPAPYLIWSATVCILSLWINCLTVNAETKVEIPFDPFEMLTTAYCMGEVTASGAKARYGIAAAMREWMGLTAIVYSRDDDGSLGVVLGHFEILDTGKGGDKFNTGMGAIERGEVIDIYFPALDGCREWMELTGGKVWIQLVDAKG